MSHCIQRSSFAIMTVHRQIHVLDKTLLISILAPRFEPLQESPVSSEASPEQTETQTNSSLISKSLESETQTFSDSGQSQTYLEVTQARQVSTSPSSGDTQTSQSYQSRDSGQRQIRVASVSPV